MRSIYVVNEQGQQDVLPAFRELELMTMQRLMLSMALVLAAALASAQAPAQSDDAQQCVALMQAGDMPGFEACIEAMQQKILGSNPEAAGYLQQLQQAEQAENTRRQQADQQRAAQKGTYEDRQQARRCIDDQSEAGEPDGAQRDYMFKYVNTCEQTVHMQFCVVDGPNKPSQRRSFAVQPGAAEQFVLRLSMYSPLVVTDHCLEPGQCRQAGAMNCSEGG